MTVADDKKRLRPEKTAAQKGWLVDELTTRIKEVKSSICPEWHCVKEFSRKFVRGRRPKNLIVEVLGILQPFQGFRMTALRLTQRHSVLFPLTFLN